jgi:transposase
MRGEQDQQQAMMFVICPEDMIPSDHPIRAIKKLADLELQRLSPLFDTMYSMEGRPSIPPEYLLKAALLMALFTVRSERQVCEQLQYNFMFRWFLGMQVDEVVFNDSVFAKNKERLLKADVARAFFEGVVQQARDADLLSPDHFTVDGTLIDAWASLKSFQKKDKPDEGTPPDELSRNPDVDFKGEKRSNQTHESKTDLEAKLARKGFGKEARMSFSAHVLMENRNGMCMDISVAEANGTAECDEALELIKKEKEKGSKVKTVGADKGYDRKSFVDGLKAEKVTPHVAAKKKYSAMDPRTLRSKGYTISQRCRKKVEEIFGWMKTVGGFRKTRYKGVARTGFCAYMVGAAYNLVRMSKLMAG